MVAEGKNPSQIARRYWTSRRTAQGLRPARRFSRPAELSEEELRGGGEGDVAVPAVPGAAFEVVQAEGGLQFAAVAF